MNARVLVAILIVATVLGGLGVAFAIMSTDDGSVERQLQDRVTSLTQQRDDARDAVAELDAELATVRQQLQDAQADNDGLTDRAVDLEAQIATLTEQRAGALATADALSARVTELEATIDELNGQADVLDRELATANQRAATAISERDALAKLFPMTFDASLADVSMVGDYDVAIAQVHCSGLASCGKAPAIKELTISRTSKGWLWLKVPGFVEGGLSRTGGALHSVAHSTTAIPKCDGAARQAEVTMTLFPGSFRIADDGSRTVTSVGAVLQVEAPAVGACPAALAFYSVELTR